MTAFGILAIQYHTDGQPLNGWLESFDPEVNDGVRWGYAKFTQDAERAMQFDSIAAALAYTLTQPKGKPTRPDGRPNMPLRAFTIEIKPLP